MFRFVSVPESVNNAVFYSDPRDPQTEVVTMFISLTFLFPCSRGSVRKLEAVVPSFCPCFFDFVL